MTVDALDPGSDFTFPNCPRTEAGYLDEQRMPVEAYVDHGKLIDPCPTVRGPDGLLHRITDFVARQPR